MANKQIVVTCSDELHKKLFDFQYDIDKYIEHLINDKDSIEPPEVLAAKLIDVWATTHKRQAPWITAVKIAAIITKMDDVERDRLLAL